MYHIKFFCSSYVGILVYISCFLCPISPFSIVAVPCVFYELLALSLDSYLPAILYFRCCNNVNFPTVGLIKVYPFLSQEEHFSLWSSRPSKILLHLHICS